jgi:undecaprenyl-diphosphatase
VQGLVHRDLNRTADTRLAWSIVAGTVPIASLGLLFRDFVETGARDLRLIACSLIGLAVLLLVAERLGRRHRGMADLGFWSIQFIGLCQALALVPGSSRSGCTIMAGLFAGLTRDEAARFSFLLSLPAVAASGLLELAGLMRGGLGGEGMVALAVGVVAAAVSSYLSIDFLLRFLRRHGTYVFAHYRIALGALILWAAH